MKKLLSIFLVSLFVAGFFGLAFAEEKEDSATVESTAQSDAADKKDTAVKGEIRENIMHKMMDSMTGV